MTIELEKYECKHVQAKKYPPAAIVTMKSTSHARTELFTETALCIMCAGEVTAKLLRLERVP